MRMTSVAYAPTRHHSSAPTHLDPDAMSGDILALSGDDGRNVPKEERFYST